MALSFHVRLPLKCGTPYHGIAGFPAGIAVPHTSGRTLLNLLPRYYGALKACAQRPAPFVAGPLASPAGTYPNSELLRRGLLDAFVG